MKRICRILSIAVVSVLAIIFIVIMIKIGTKSNNKVYAETVSFISTAESLELCIDNELVINKDKVKITPTNCSFNPEFFIRGYGESVEEADPITNDKVSFNSTGKYVILCKVKSSKKYYTSDRVTVNVVQNATQNTSMYIKDINSSIRYVEDKINLEELVDMAYPNNTTIDIICSEHLDISNNVIRVLKEGIGTIEIYLTYDNFTIFETISFLIKPKIIEEDIDLILRINGNIVQNNALELQYSTFNHLINYEINPLVNNQTINCWTDSDKISIISYDSPTIILKTLAVGQASIYASSVDYPHIVFEINITII